MINCSIPISLIISLTPLIYYVFLFLLFKLEDSLSSPPGATLFKIPPPPLATSNSWNDHISPQFKPKWCAQVYSYFKSSLSSLPPPLFSLTPCSFLGCCHWLTKSRLESDISILWFLNILTVVKGTENCRTIFWFWNLSVLFRCFRQFSGCLPPLNYFLIG